MENLLSQPFGGKWTEVKLDKVQKYLSAYKTALKNQNFRLHYIDAFAGTGYCGKNRIKKQIGALVPELAEDETQEFLKGSARIALEVESPFERYIFIDNDLSNCAELNKLKTEYPTKCDSIVVLNEDANTCLQKLLNDSWDYKRAVLFLDPFGMQVEWQTIRAIAQTRAIDMWYLFPLAAVNRLLRKDANISASWKNRLNLIFGSNEWENIFYEQQSTLTLFGTDETIIKTATTNIIKDYVIDRLKTEFAGVARNPRVLVNDRNSPLFLLCFAVANPRGVQLALRLAENILVPYQPYSEHGV